MYDSGGLFPIDWMDPRAPEAATDLDLALLLVNSLDLLDDPPDRLHDVDWLTRAIGHAGHPGLAGTLTDADLPRLRSLRESLRTAFEATDAATAAAALNPLLEQASAVDLLVPDDDTVTGARLQVAPGLAGIDALAARLPAAVARHIAAHGVGRLGVCASDPCRCAFVDRTRAGTRRYCCGYCNDRHAARAYRRRRKG